MDNNHFVSFEPFLKVLYTVQQKIIILVCKVFNSVQAINAYNIVGVDFTLMCGLFPKYNGN